MEELAANIVNKFLLIGSDNDILPIIAIIFFLIYIFRNVILPAKDKFDSIADIDDIKKIDQSLVDKINELSNIQNKYYDAITLKINNIEDMMDDLKNHNFIHDSEVKNIKADIDNIKNAINRMYYSRNKDDIF